MVKLWRSFHYLSSQEQSSCRDVVSVEFCERVEHIESLHVDDGCIDAKLSPGINNISQLFTHHWDLRGRETCCYIHLHLQSLAHVLDKVCRLLAITFFLVCGDSTSSGGRIGELLVRKIPPISPSWRRHHWLKIKPEVKIAVLASSSAPIECYWCKILNLSSWLADKRESSSDWLGVRTLGRLCSQSWQVESE